jgi:N-acetylglucosaminyldiphosphoundecaprenol N-acetyl-beta-D-mannosaminyltransferase
LDGVTDAIVSASRDKRPFLLSTPNLNFAIAACSDLNLRESVLASDLSTPDGMPFVWVAKLLGIPIKERISGSDIYAKLRKASPVPLSICFFGGAPGVANQACRNLSRSNASIHCVGAIDPGAGSVDDMSSPYLIDAINRTNADILVAALGAKKGQAWLLQNHQKITIPIRSHLGAVINFEAGNIKRAPVGWQKAGFEWLWRIKEEPQLWRRYWSDGVAFLRLLACQVIPLAIFSAYLRGLSGRDPRPLHIVMEPPTEGKMACSIRLTGDALAQSAPELIESLKKTLKHEFPYLVIDLSGVRGIDQRILGLFLMLRKVLWNRGAPLALIGLTGRMRRFLHWNGCGYLMAARPPERSNQQGVSNA